MREPSDIAVSGREFYVCDFKGHNVVVFTEEGQFVRRIGGENITNFPNGIDISGDNRQVSTAYYWPSDYRCWWHTYRGLSWQQVPRGGVRQWRQPLGGIRMSSCKGRKSRERMWVRVTIRDFQVSRCCGLKITSEGYVVTLAKNNHHVLVLNTLYIA